MDHICYVIMPFGGDDPRKRARYEAIYTNIISAAARAAGFSDDEIIRQDHSGDAGSITRNIVTNISRACVVVADLTDANANVYYETGIAHVLHKSSTVLVIDKSSKAMFDVGHLNMVQYSIDIEEQKLSIDAIADAIVRRLKQKVSADSPVHEVITKLPAHLLDWLEQDQDAQRMRISELEQEKGQLIKQIVDLGGKPGVVTQAKKSQQQLFAEARLALQVSGSIAVDRIEALAKAGKLEELLGFLEEVFSHGKISNSDASRIVKICEDTDNEVVTECTLQILAEKFPRDTAIKTKLAKLFAAQPGKKNEAVDLINEALGLQKDASGEYCAVDLKTLSHNNLARTLDTYLRLELYDELIDVCRFLMDHGAEQHKDMLITNIFLALSRGFRLEEADAMLPQVERLNTGWTNYCIAFHYDRKGDTIKEYYYFERAAIADPTDPDYPRILAGHILDEKVLRIDSEIRHVSTQEAQVGALAFLFRSLQVARNTGNSSAFQDVLTILNRKSNGLTRFVEDALQYVRGQLDELPFGECNMAPLQYCLERVNCN